MRLKKKSDTGVLGVIQAELELGGRRLVVMEAMGKTEAEKKRTEDEGSKKARVDKRNTDMKKEGLVNYNDWIHKFPSPKPKQME